MYVCMYAFSIDLGNRKREGVLGDEVEGYRGCPQAQSRREGSDATAIGLRSRGHLFS